MKSKILGLLALVVLASSPAYSATYSVNRTIGVGGVTGTITTDGTLGVLSSGNILDWSLALNDGTGPFTLFGPLSGNNSQLGVNGSSFMASASDLMFDFSNAASAWVLFQNPTLGSGINFWCLDGALNGCSGNVSAETVTTSGAFAAVRAARQGVLSVASASVPVPEPGTLALLGLGLLGLGMSRRKA